MLKVEDISNRLNRDTKILVDGILANSPTPPIAILLTGGYGRGEGAWFEDENGNPSPYNDYDLSVITEKPMSADVYRVLRMQLAEKVGIKWVDIDNYKPAKLRKLVSTIHNIDLLYASTLLWGDTQWNRFCPQLDARAIGTFDLLYLYRTRMWTLLGSWQGEFRDLNVEESRFFKNQMAKCGLACCDMLLISKKAYHTSYRKRSELISELFPEFTDVCRLAEWAIEEKTHPSCSTISKSEMENLYKLVHFCFLQCFKKSLAPHISIFFLNPNITSLYYKFNIKHILLSFKMRIRGINNQLKKQDDVFYAQNYILLAYNGNNINRDYLIKASKLLKKWGYINDTVVDWNALRVIAANARNNI